MRVPIDISSLTTAEKLDLIHEIWISLPSRVASPPLSRGVKRMLDSRLEDLTRNPEASTPWPEVRARVFRRKPGR